MSILNTRLSRCAHVIAMDGMYAGFAGAKTGHGGALFHQGFVSLFDAAALGLVFYGERGGESPYSGE